MGCVARNCSETIPVGHIAMAVVRLEDRAHFDRRVRGRYNPGCWRFVG